MQPEGHEKKARRLEATIRKLSDAPDFEAIVELCYALAVQYLAMVCTTRVRRHMDTHKGLAAFLVQNGLSDLAESFRDLDLLRTSRYYGARGDGKAAREARRILDEIKAKLH